jgi:hypothetical protein
MRIDQKTKDGLFIIMSWVLAIALLYLVFVKIFHL